MEGFSFPFDLCEDSGGGSEVSASASLYPRTVATDSCEVDFVLVSERKKERKKVGSFLAYKSGANVLVWLISFLD